jgi:hypothetical protein
MKKNYGLALMMLGFVLVCGACRKTSGKATENADYYLKFKFDGVDKTMINPHGGINISGAVPGAAIYGSFAGDTAKESSILILDSLPISTGKTYQCILVLADGKNAVPQALFNYYDEHNTSYYATYTGYITGPDPELAINVRLSEITSGHLKGSFDATVKKYYDKPPYVLHQLTDGEFNLKRDY